MKPVLWKDNKVHMVDQRRLPTEEIWLTYETAEAVADAIKTMVVRGAPAIGVSAAYGLALEALNFDGTRDSLLSALEAKAAILEATRPTAINLKWALDRMLRFARKGSHSDVKELCSALVEEAQEIHAEDIRLCKAIGDAGATLIPQGAKVLTHCNAGALATGDYGTALGVIRSARDKISHVWVDETRPFLQGARLTAWELMKEEIPCRLICDNMAGHFMQRRMVDAVVVGADRITANGAVANKIGTYNLAVLCRFHEIPLYVAAPYSTVDLNLSDGMDIPIEERDRREVTHVGQTQIAPDNVPVANPAFDVTPPELVSAIITERGVIKAPFAQGLAELVEAAGR
ncbi:MAG TPA: S-methyl-5-thioribose-1-phosphate isomerase [Phycisphaerales bacterium]|nr:S-methyl-5-thioribose-1-phosphate isomerase [Phycisphaerales bacterium]